MNKPFKVLEDYSFIIIGAKVVVINENIDIRGTIIDISDKDVTAETEITIYVETDKDPFSYTVKAKDVYSLYITNKERFFIYEFISNYESGKYIDINLLIAYLKYNYNINVKFDITEYSRSKRNSIFRCIYRNTVFKTVQANIIKDSDETNTFDGYYRAYTTSMLAAIRNSIEFITENKVPRKFPRLSFINIITPIRYGS